MQVRSYLSSAASRSHWNRYPSFMSVFERQSVSVRLSIRFVLPFRIVYSHSVAVFSPLSAAVSVT